MTATQVLLQEREGEGGEGEQNSPPQAHCQSLCYRGNSRTTKKEQYTRRAGKGVLPLKRRRVNDTIDMLDMLLLVYVMLVCCFFVVGFFFVCFSV